HLSNKNLALIEAAIASGINAPLASSCGRLFDAVAAALGLSPDRQGHEGEVATRLEALAQQDVTEAGAYPFAVVGPGDGQPMQLDRGRMWGGVLGDLAAGVPAPTVAARFHHGLADALARLAATLAAAHSCDTAALTGGCFQNALLLQAMERRLTEAGLVV